MPARRHPRAHPGPPNVSASGVVPYANCALRPSTSWQRNRINIALGRPDATAIRGTAALQHGWINYTGTQASQAHDKHGTANIARLAGLKFLTASFLDISVEDGALAARPGCVPSSIRKRISDERFDINLGARDVLILRTTDRWILIDVSMNKRAWKALSEFQLARYLIIGFSFIRNFIFSFYSFDNLMSFFVHDVQDEYFSDTCNWLSSRVATCCAIRRPLVTIPRQWKVSGRGEWSGTKVIFLDTRNFPLEFAGFSVYGHLPVCRVKNTRNFHSGQIIIRPQLRIPDFRFDSAKDSPPFQFFRHEGHMKTAIKVCVCSSKSQVPLIRATNTISSVLTRNNFFALDSYSEFQLKKLETRRLDGTLRHDENLSFFQTSK